MSKRNGKLRARGYVRMSTSAQDASPDQQRNAMEQLAESNGYRLDGWYDDLGISGTATDTRADFLKMLDDDDLNDATKLLAKWRVESDAVGPA